MEGIVESLFRLAVKNRNHVSHEKKFSYFPLNPGCLIGILTMVLFSPQNLKQLGFCWSPESIPGIGGYVFVRLPAEGSLIFSGIFSLSNFARIFCIFSERNDTNLPVFG